MPSLIDNWLLAESEAGAFKSPAALDVGCSNKWVQGIVPGTVAQALQVAGLWTLGDKLDFDAKDWWYKTQFDYPENLKNLKYIFLSLEGLSTHCEIWLNGKVLGVTNNMFVEQRINITDKLQKNNSLYLCFRSLNALLAQRQQRPRWKTKLVAQQTLRSQRASLVGRIPGWMPPVAPVGPWKNIYISNNLEPTKICVNTQLDKLTGVVEFSCEVSNSDSNFSAFLSVGENQIELSISKQNNLFTLTGKIEINDLNLWWPHTHGVPYLYDMQLIIKHNNKVVYHALSSIGFKAVELDQSNQKFILKVNDETIFCRGACWTINDIVSLSGEESDLENVLILMRDAGANMIRIGGTMIYEQNLFYELCNKLGIMIWQDFMFANMDYPVDNKDFLNSITEEVSQKISALNRHVCVSVYCGNSEIEQQASMLGMEEDIWSNDFFSSALPALCNELHKGIPYIPSTPTTGVLPFHTNTGVTHYYGVGAYLCSVSELRQHNVQFTSECLGFANIPISQTRNLLLNGQLPVIHNPKWKERVPRDTGTGWDFEDIRDHYFKRFYGIDPIECRSYEIEKYLALSENITGEIMSQVFSEWRSQYSQCNGALVWFLKDLWPGAGWGVIDSLGNPKACYYYLKRTWQPVSVLITNETLNGLHFHLINETDKDISAILEMKLLSEKGGVMQSVKTDIDLLNKSIKLIQSDELLGAFFDVTYSYRFGPLKHSVVAVQLKSNEGEVLSESFYFNKPYTPKVYDEIDITVTSKKINEETYQLDLICNKFLYAINIEVDGFVAADNFFSLVPGSVRSILMHKIKNKERKFRGYISALNLAEAVKIKVCTS